MIHWCCDPPRLPYPQYFGGVSAVTPDQYMKMNGFPNQYWGWGGEDDDIAARWGGWMSAEPHIQLGDRVGCRLLTWAQHQNYMHALNPLCFLYFLVIFFDSFVFLFMLLRHFCFLWRVFYVSSYHFSSSRPLPLLWLCCVSLRVGSVSMLAWISSQFWAGLHAKEFSGSPFLQCWGALSPLSGSSSICHCVITKTEWKGEKKACSIFTSG